MESSNDPQVFLKSLKQAGSRVLEALQGLSDVVNEELGSIVEQYDRLVGESERSDDGAAAREDRVRVMVRFLIDHYKNVDGSPMAGGAR